MEIPKEAICPKGKLHKYDDAKEYKDAFVEFCISCGTKRIYHKDKSGRIDNRVYLRSHYRSFVQPYGSTGQHFRMVWGDKIYFKAMRNTKWKKKVDWDEASNDAKKYLRELKADRTYA
jgi:hypothetical protein